MIKLFLTFRLYYQDAAEKRSTFTFYQTNVCRSNCRLLNNTSAKISKLFIHVFSSSFLQVFCLKFKLVFRLQRMKNCLLKMHLFNKKTETNRLISALAALVSYIFKSRGTCSGWSGSQFISALLCSASDNVMNGAWVDFCEL